jgi:hypothetical protein
LEVSTNFDKLYCGLQEVYELVRVKNRVVDLNYRLKYEFGNKSRNDEILANYSVNINSEDLMNNICETDNSTRRT